MALVSPVDVRVIMDTELDDATLAVYASIAEQLLSSVYADDTTLADGQRKEIGRWLTAHLVATSREPQVQRMSAADVSIQYSGLTGKGLEATHYGQTALAMDTTGRLRTLGKRRARLTAIVSEQD